MMQGDEYSIGLKITMDGQPLEGEKDVEVMIGGIRKLMSAGDISFDSETGEYLVSVTQNETFIMRKEEPVKVRVLFASGEVIGADAGVLTVDKSNSKVVLKNA